MNMRVSLRFFFLPNEVVETVGRATGGLSGGAFRSQPSLKVFSSRPHTASAPAAQRLRRGQQQAATHLHLPQVLEAAVPAARENQREPREGRILR